MSDERAGDGRADDGRAGNERARDERANGGRANDGPHGAAGPVRDVPKTQRLGRGLAALIGDLDAPRGGGRSGSRGAERPRDERSVPINAVRRNPANPRRAFDPVELDELATSLREHGFLSPIVVRPVAGEEGQFEIVAGERRWRAAQRAELAHVPIIVREVDDRLALELAIVENVQRTDLNAIEEARGYEQLVERGYTQDELARIIGKSRPHVTNTLRLMRLPEPVRRMVGDGSLSAGHARALLSCPEPEALAARVVEDGMTVRQTERAAKAATTVAERPHEPARPREKDPDAREWERRLSESLRVPVSVDAGAKGGRLVLRYRNADEFAALVRRLSDFD